MQDVGVPSIFLLTSVDTDMNSAHSNKLTSFVKTIADLTWL